jgi:hypothetical protein
MRRAAIKAVARTAMTSVSLALLGMASVAPTVVLAQEAIPTAPSSPGYGAPPMPESGPLRLSDRIDQGPDVLRPAGPCGGPARKEDGSLDKSPHGEVWAGVGTRGYRDVGGVVCAPLGENAAVSIAVDAGQINGWGGRR